MGEITSTRMSASDNHDRAQAPPPSADPLLFFNLPPYGDHLEARGWAFDSIGRSLSVVGNSVFTGTAVIHLARMDAGCEPDEGECTGRTHGVRPSSFLSLYNVVVGLSSSALLPLLGAIVDHTHHRLLLGRISAVAYCAAIFPMIFLSQSTWFAVAILLIVNAFVGWIHTGMAFAYLPEMSNDRKVMERLNASFTSVQFGTGVVFILLVVAISTASGWMDDSLATARLAQSINFTVTFVVWGYSWFKLLQPRQAMSVVPEGSRLLTVGFRKIYHTSIHIFNNHKPLAWFYTSIAFSDSATQALLIIGIAYSIELLNFSAVETGITVFILLVSSSVGCFVSPLSFRRMSPVRSNQLCIFLIALTTTGVALFISNASHKGLFYLFAAFWGTCGGWKYTTERFIAVTIIPEGQDAELMGMYLFSGQILSWLPPLVFTAMNEANISIRISMISLLLFWLIAIICLQCMGSYECAVRAQPGAVVEEETAETNNSDEQDSMSRAGSSNEGYHS